jgi:peptidoglycan/LPS O-acetylase OafA/YrhL
MVTQLLGKASSGVRFAVQCDLVLPRGDAQGKSKVAEEIFGWGGVPVSYPNQIEATNGLVIMLVVCAFIAVLMFVGTALDLRRRAIEEQAHAHQHRPAEIQASLITAAPMLPLALAQGTVTRTARTALGPLERFMNHWSLVRNSESFMRLRGSSQNTFACMDAIRVLSMCQVIAGHMFIYPMMSSGVSNMEQFMPPNGLLGEFWFMLIPGCFYGVDSFFLMSGFLCAHGLQQKVFSKQGSTSPKSFSFLYLKFVFLRYVRLLPLEMFCIAFVVNVLPQLGTGILWNLERPDGSYCFSGAGGAGCEQYWWTNILFIQNMDAYLGKCFAHTWYLAADMQIYLTAPFFSLAYAVNRKLGWSVLSIALAVGIVLPPAMMAYYDFVPDMMLGNAQGFAKHVYMKPWCRLAPFVIGIAVAWLWEERLVNDKGPHVSFYGMLRSYGLSFLGLLLCFAATFGRLILYQGDISTCSDINTNPAGKVFMYLWAGLSIPTWAAGIAIIMVLCFQRRFLPMMQNLLCHSFWQPLAKLSYAVYLIHTSVLILDFCQRQMMVSYIASLFAYQLVSYVALAMFAAYCLYMSVEKPLANLQMQLLGGAEA